jgi:hypothetical protein
MTPDDLRALVAAMRELGVLEADGVKLGPAPTTRQDLETAAKNERDPATRKQLQAAVAEEKRREFVESWHAETREMLAAASPNATDEECERYRPLPDA